MFKFAIYAFVICSVECWLVQSRTMVERAQANYDSAKCKKFLIPAGKVYEWFWKGPNGVTYNGARAECKKRGGDLAVLSSKDDQNTIAKLFIQQGRLWNKRSWIGLTKIGANMTWVSGEKLALDTELRFFADSNYQSSSIAGAGNLNDYGEIDIAAENNKLSFVCQFSSFTERKRGADAWFCDDE